MGQRGHLVGTRCPDCDTVHRPQFSGRCPKKQSATPIDYILVQLISQRLGLLPSVCVRRFQRLNCKITTRVVGGQVPPRTHSSKTHRRS
ncbi:MAG: hypothetical protein JOY55_08145 [Mycobacterium sp.]|nr:hypothetical protein [Mycobacterium sp.]